MIEHDLVENDTIAGRLDIYMVTTHVKIFVDGRDNLSSYKIFLVWIYVVFENFFVISFTYRLHSAAIFR